MKKKLLILTMLFFSITVFGQNNKFVPLHPSSKPVKIYPLSKNVQNIKLLVPKKIAEGSSVPVNNNKSLEMLSAVPVSKVTMSVTETIIGNTYYDLQTNGTISNRLIKNPDGTISAVWTTSCGNQGVDRG